MIGTDCERSVGGEGVVAQVHGSELVEHADVEGFERIVLKVKDLDVGALAEVNGFHVTTDALEVVDQ